MKEIFEGIYNWNLKTIFLKKFRLREGERVRGKKFLRKK